MIRTGHGIYLPTDQVVCRQFPVNQVMFMGKNDTKTEALWYRICKGNQHRFIFLCVGFCIYILFASYLLNSPPDKKNISLADNKTPEGIYDSDYVEFSDSFATDEELEMLIKSLSDNQASDIISNTVYGNEDADIKIFDDDSKTYLSAGFEDDWCLVLLNKTHRIPSDYKFEVSNIKGNIRCDTRIVQAVLQMIKGAREDGVELLVCSPYRDTKRQEMLFNNKIKSYTKQGYDYEKAYDLASQTVAVPGTSEHEVGMAIDFVTPGYTLLNEGFADTAAGIWLKENAADYGFILRYPKDKEDITRIEFEPWHYRYVGLGASHYIMDNGLCLEEYVSEIGMVDDAL